MKKGYLVALFFGLLLMASAPVSAVTIGTYTHNYGNGSGQFNPGGNDVLSNGYVTVSDQSTDRFNDSFGFSGLSYSAINHFDLVLTYSNTNGAFLNPELWFTRPGGTPDQYLNFDNMLTSTGNTPVSQTFTVNSTLIPEFNQMVAAQNFYFWFAEETWFRDSFKLYSAALTIDGEVAQTAVPEPATMMLFGLGLLGLAGLRRKLKK